MCEIYGFSETEANWNDTEALKESFIELFGVKRHVSVLNNKSKLASKTINDVNLKCSLLMGHIETSNSNYAHFPAREFGGSIEGKVSIQIGGKKGSKMSGELSGQYRNKNGSHGKIGIEYQENGEIFINAAGGYDRDEYEVNKDRN